ncbi:MAG: hypothetical protein AB7S36_23655, partial [Planctomycetota bacterium]
ALPAITGKLELVYEGEQEGSFRIATLLVGKAIRKEFEDLFLSAYRNEPDSRGRRSRTGKANLDDDPQQDAGGDLGVYKRIIDHFKDGRKLELTDDLPQKEYQKRLESVPGLHEVVAAHLGTKDGPTHYVAMELVLEGLHQASLLAKEDIDRGLLYCDMLGSMFDDM